MKEKSEESLTCVDCEKNEMAWEWYCKTHDHLVRAMNCNVWLSIYHIWENRPCIEFLTAYVKAHEEQLGEIWACADIVSKTPTTEGACNVETAVYHKKVGTYNSIMTILNDVTIEWKEQEHDAAHVLAQEEAYYRQYFES